MHPIQRRSLLAVGAASLAFPAVHVRAQAKIPMTIGYTAVPDFGMAFVANERGFFDKQGIDAKLLLITLTSNVPAAMVSDSVQIGGITPPVFLQAADSGLDLVGLSAGSTFFKERKAIGVLAKAGGPVTSVKDLVGRKVGVPGLRGNLDLLVRRWLARAGIDPKSVTFIEVPLPSMPQVLASGNIDAIVTAEPTITRLVNSKAAVVVPGFIEGLPDNWSVVMYSATRKWALANTKAVKGFRAAIAEAVAFAKDNPDGAMQDIGKYFKVPPEVLKATPMPNFVAGLTQEQLRFWSDTMREQNILTKQPMLSSLLLA